MKLFVFVICLMQAAGVWGGVFVRGSSRKCPSSYHSLSHSYNINSFFDTQGAEMFFFPFLHILFLYSLF